MMSAYGDPDGDAPMRSSSSSDNESEAMFPSANDPPASQNDAALAQLRQAGLSPPSSQDPPHLNGTSVDMMEVIESEDFPNGEASNVQSGARRVHGEGQEADKEPGYAWSNPRAREEYARAMDSMLDKDFSIEEYGDLFDGHIIDDKAIPEDEPILEDEFQFGTTQ